MLVVLLACAPGPRPDGVDHWAAAREVCGEPSEECAAVLSADFGVDPFEHVDNVIEALRFLVTWDLGAWPPDERALVRDEAFALFEGWSGGSTTARVYNHAVVAVERVVVSDERTLEEGLLGLYDDGVVYLSTPLSSFSPASVAPSLVHEASHATWPGHHDCEGESCDPSWAGAFGTQAGVAWLASQTAQGIDAATLAAVAEDAATHVAP